MGISSTNGHGLDREEQSSLSSLSGPTLEEGDDVRDWIALLKPRVMSLVIFTGAIGIVIAPGHLHPVLAFTAILCIAVAAGACGAITCGTTAISTR